MTRNHPYYVGWKVFVIAVCVFKIVFFTYANIEFWFNLRLTVSRGAAHAANGVLKNYLQQSLYLPMVDAERVLSNDLTTAISISRFISW